MKTTKRWNKLFLMGMAGLSLFLTTYMLIGCASTGEAADSTSPGTLVVTGIPEEYNGKFVSLGSIGLDRALPFVASAEKPKDNFGGTGLVIANGEVNIPLYIYKESFIPLVGPKVSGYAGNDTITIGFCIKDATKQINPAHVDNAVDAIFELVTFENGTASVNWDDAFKAGSITITNIPDEFNNSEATVFLGYSGGNNSGAKPEMGLKARVDDGRVTVKIFRESSGDSRGRVIANAPLRSYTVTDTKDILLSIQILRTSDSHGITKENLVNAVADSISITALESITLFKAAQITNGKVVLNFASGIKQK
jgi:hypothetical protein